MVKKTGGIQLKRLMDTFFLCTIKVLLRIINSPLSELKKELYECDIINDNSGIRWTVVSKDISEGVVV